VRDVLKGDWKFDGFVMSDWTSTYDGVAAASAGLDLEMPFAQHMNRDTLLSAMKDGKVSMATIDDKVRRMLRVMFRFGFFDRSQTDSTLPLYNPDSRLVALEAAREGIVLLKNAGNQERCCCWPQRSPGCDRGRGQLAGPSVSLHKHA
jgi:beta-glucosidase